MRDYSIHYLDTYYRVKIIPHGQQFLVRVTNTHTLEEYFGLVNSEDDIPEAVEIELKYLSRRMYLQIFSSIHMKGFENF